MYKSKAEQVDLSFCERLIEDIATLERAEKVGKRKSGVDGMVTSL